MTTRSPEPPMGNPRLAIWKSPLVLLATGFGIGCVSPAPGTAGAALFGLPLAWAISQLPGLGWQLAAIVGLNLIGIPLATKAGRALGGQKDDQAIIWDELATVPVVFAFVPPTTWAAGLIGFALHRMLDIAKPPPAGQLERLPEGLGVMADDWMSSIYACILMTGFGWLDRTAAWGLVFSSG